MRIQILTLVPLLPSLCVCENVEKENLLAVFGWNCISSISFIYTLSKVQKNTSIFRGCQKICFQSFNLEAYPENNTTCFSCALWNFKQ